MQRAQTNHQSRGGVEEAGGVVLVAGVADVEVVVGGVLVAVETVSRSQMGHREGPGGLPVQV